MRRLITCVFVLVVGLAARVEGQPVFDAAGVNPQTASTTNTLSFTLGAGANRVLYCNASSFGNGVSVTSVLYDGDAGVELFDNAGSPGFIHAAMYRWKESSGLATGTANVVATFGGSTPTTLACMSFSGVDQTTPDDGIDTARATGVGAVANALTSATGDLAVDFVSYGGGVTSGTVSAGTERVDNFFAGDAQLSLASTRTGAASVNMDWTVTGGIGAYVSMAFNLNAAGGGGGASTGLTVQASTLGVGQ